MSKRIYLHWTNNELEYLTKNYGKLPQETVIENLQNRNWLAISKKAQVLGLKHPDFGKKKADISVLLHENPITYYWLGFLLADGTFTDRRIGIGVADIDLLHLKKLLSYVNSSNKIQNLYEGTYHRAKLTNVSVVQQLKEKFSISSRKTYEPCVLENIPDDLFFSLIVGFIDGDGSISKIYKESCFRLSVVGHQSWLFNFQKMQAFLYQYLSVNHDYRPAYLRNAKVKLPQNKHLTEHTLATFYCSYTPLLRLLKQRADELGLPYLERKLGQMSS